MKETGETYFSEKKTACMRLVEFSDVIYDRNTLHLYTRNAILSSNSCGTDGRGHNFPSARPSILGKREPSPAHSSASEWRVGAREPRRCGQRSSAGRIYLGGSGRKTEPYPKALSHTQYQVVGASYRRPSQRDEKTHFAPKPRAEWVDS